VNKKSNQALRGLVLALAGVGAQIIHVGNALAAETSKPSAAEERAGIVKSVRGDVQLLSGSADMVAWCSSSQTTSGGAPTTRV